MAGFQEELVQFNPYIQQIPVDDYVRVGMIKQEQYNAGVQKVQGYIDSVAGLDVVKPEQKDYLQQRVGQLQGEVSKIVQQDFSNMQIAGSVGHLTNQIASDPIVQNAVYSTQKYRSGQSAMKKAQDEGKSSPSNEFVFQRSVAQWLGDKDATSTFNGEYNPYVDYKKKMVDSLNKELGKPDEFLEDIPFKRDIHGQIEKDPNGQPVFDYQMMEKAYKGVSADRIKMIVDASLDENDRRQIAYDGQYEYRGLDKQAMKEKTQASYNYRLGQVNDTIQSLMAEASHANQGDTNYLSSLQAQIAQLKNKATSYQDGYKKDIANLDANPEAFKSQLYMDDWMHKMGEGYSYAQRSLTYKENPGFMASQKELENRLKFEEFKVNKQFEAARIGIAQQNANSESERAEIEKYKVGLQSKFGKGGKNPEDEIKLSGVGVRGSINQADIENITADNFVKEVDRLNNVIDTQKMALMAQLTPQYVGVVTDDDGKNPHYDYLVKGKNPDEVKASAGSFLNKIHESYKNGELVSDAAKTFFDNLGNTSNRVNKSMFAINKLQQEADEKYNLKPQLSKITPLTLSTPSGTYHVSPETMMQFNEKMSAITTASPLGPVYNEDLANKVLTTPEERLMYQAVRKSKGLTDSDHLIRNTLNTVHNTVNVPSSGVIQKRNEFLNNRVRSIVGVNEPVSFPIKSAKPEDKTLVRSVIGTMLNDINTDKKSNSNPNFDADKINAALDDEKNTTYELVDRGGGKMAIRLSNEKKSEGKPLEIDITNDQANDLFGRQLNIDDFQNIRQSLQLSKSTGNWTTDVEGNGRESAFTLTNGLIKKYGVQYHVEEPLKNGKLQVRLYLYDKEHKTQLPERTLTFGTLLNESEVIKSLAGLSDAALDDLLKKNQ